MFAAARRDEPQDMHVFCIVPPIGEIYQREDMCTHLFQVLSMQFPMTGFIIAEGDEVMRRTDSFVVGALDDGQEISVAHGYRVVPAPSERIDEILAACREFDNMLHHRKR
ncbi:hypothetical protein [Mesorhizobium sp. IMUNJ 23232]|uniref:hypothetical protein n=1 Tax=Mesorhizobium sp. IMUNJ 23232 TaxID=3376064 RepID=UPI0037B0D7FD